MNFIKKIFEKKIDEEVKKQFARYSKGIFEGRAVIKIKIERDSFKLQTSFEYVNDIINLITNNISEADVNGKLVKNRKKEEVSTVVTSEELRGFIQEYDFLLLNIKSGDISLKSKPSLPKPGKSLKPDFCTAYLPLKLLKEFTFDINEDFKNLEIKHTIEIKEITVPKEFDNDPVMSRKMAIRKGKIIRNILLDKKKEIVKEIDFEI